MKPVIPVALAFTENIANTLATSAVINQAQTSRHVVTKDAGETD